jgi:hypothetical protein
MVEGLQHALSGHDGNHVAAGEEQVVATGPCAELGIHGLVGVECVDAHAHAELFLEFADDGRIHVVGPVVDVEYGLTAAAAAEHDDCDEAEDEFVYHFHFLFSLFASV